MIRPTPPAPPAVDVGALEALQALADEKRLAILEVLRGGERCVCELQETLGLAQSLLSHHLGVLRRAGLVRARRAGRWMHYSMDGGAVRSLEEALAGLRTPAEGERRRASACAPGPFQPQRT